MEAPVATSPQMRRLRLRRFADPNREPHQRKVGSLWLLMLFLAAWSARPARAVQTAYDSGDPTADEQQVLEMINRARANPAAEGARLHININEGLAAGTSAVVRPPLAMNKILLGTARVHSEDMFARNYFAHDTPEGVDPFDRMTAAGYNWMAAGENIAFGSGGFTSAALEDGLMKDQGIPGRGHRVNLLDIGHSGAPVLYREVGVGVKAGTVMSMEKRYLTQDFGSTGTTGPFLLGVVYHDANHNEFYDPGEGLAGVTIVPDAGNFMAVTGDAGGYAFPVGASGTLMVTASGGGLPAPVTVHVTLHGENVKVDFTPNGSPGAPLPADTAAALGGSVTGEAGTTKYVAVGGPQAGPFAGTMLVGKVKTPAIFAADGSVRVQVGDGAPGLSETVITKLGAPNGGVVRATLAVRSGGVTAADNEVLLGGLTNGALAVVARKGQSVTGLTDVKIKKILQFDGAGPDYFFLAQLQGGDVTAKSDSALCAAPGDGSVRVVMRENQAFGDLHVRTISTLVALPGTLAEGRWRVSAQAFGVRVTFDDKSQQFFTVPSNATSSADWIPWLATEENLQGGVVRTLGFPGFGASGPACVVTLKSGTSKIPAASDTLVLRCATGGITILATENDPVPDAAGTAIPEAKFKSFGTPVSGANGRTAFTATIAGVKGTTGIWAAADGVHLRQLARAGSPAPGGGNFAKFGQLVLSDEAAGRLYFTATLAPDRALGLSAANNSGIWAVGSDGQLVRVVHTGQAIDAAGGGRVLKNFTALTSAADSLGSASGYDAAGHIALRATFTDKTVALIRLAVP